MMNRPSPAPSPPARQLTPWLIMALGLVALALVLGRISPPPARTEISYSHFKELIRAGEVQQVTLQGELAEGQLYRDKVLNPGAAPVRHFSARLPTFGDESLLPSLEQAGVEVTVSARQETSPLLQILLGLIPWLLFLGIFVWLMRRAARNLGGGPIGGGGELKGFLQGTTREAVIPDVRFADVAGQDNAKREVTELVEYLRDPQRFRKLGAQIPKGVLLMGAPGTGKTLLAKALAGEAGVPFYSISGSEFIEVFVGVGAARVRHLFREARKHAPSIIFIDELDSVGRTRGTGLGGGHDEREQTLNQILAEMDGFTEREAVLMLAATNRPDVLDPALLRPGRFDRHVTLELPDRRDRKAILEIHTRKIPLAADVDLDQVAAACPGFSGAELKNLANEAAIIGARRNEEQVTRADFDQALDKILMGAERSLVIEPEERRRLAIHEAGHALVAWHLPNCDKLYKVTIIPRGQALGGTFQLPEHERHTLPEEYLKDRLAVILAGRCAERILCGSVSSGADDDIHRATLTARAMVTRWGMSEQVGPVDLRESEEHPFLGREMAQPRHYSEHSSELVDEAVKDLLDQAQQRATAVLEHHRDSLSRLVEALEKEETLYQDKVAEILQPAAGSDKVTRLDGRP